MRRSALVSAALSAVLLLAILPSPAAEASLFTTLEGFATKTGFRGVVAWQAARPVKGLVHYGTSPTDLSSTLENVPGSVDAAGIAILEGLTVGHTYYWQVEDLITGERSEISSFEAKNAYNDWNGSTYTLDVLVQLDSESLPKEVPHDMALENAAQGVNIFAERLYDATDGFARLGNVIVTDTEVDYVGSIQGAEAPNCTAIEGAGGNLADVLIQTAVPFDSHTFGGWAIDDPCISFYVGRLGQLIVPWGSSEAEDLHFGYVATHEMMHYAFNAPDLYNLADINDPRRGGCWNLDWDGSLMHNDGGWNGKRWEFTELDRNPDLTPCEHDDDPDYTWDALRERYTEVPLRPDGPIEHIVDRKARGNEDGGALDIKILNRTGPLSTLESFAPDDTSPPVVPETDCTVSSGPIITDPEGDATSGIQVNETDLDILNGSLAWDATEQALTFSIEVDDLKETNPASSPNVSYNFNFTHEGEELYVEAARTSGGESFVAGSFVGTPGVNPRLHHVDVTGSFDPINDRINIVLPNSAMTEMDSATFDTGDRITAMDIVSRRAAPAGVTTAGLAADLTDGSCDFVIGSGNSGPPPPPPPPPADVTATVIPFHYEWDGHKATNIDQIEGVEIFGCDGIEGAGCDEERVYVEPPAEGLQLDVSIAAESPNVNDVDLYVFGPDGQEVDRSGSFDTSPGAEAVSATITRAGLYTIQVRYWLTVDAAYHGILDIKAITPPPAVEYEAEISLGDSYQWEGSPPVRGNPAFTCAPLIMSICDNTYIKVNIPDGGAKLQINITPNTAGERFSLWVYDPAGNQYSGGSTGSYSRDFTQSGVYRIGVTTATSLGSYKGAVSLVPKA